MSEEMTVEKVQEILNGSPFIKAFGMKIVELDAENERIVMTMPMHPIAERREGTGQYHGGAIASLIDTAGDFALIARLGGPVPTVNFRTDYLRPAMNTDLRATATVRRAGRTVAVVDIDVHDDQGRLCAVGRGTYSTQLG
jgi:uncharacterized protein (TIGR00369 family)